MVKLRRATPDRLSHAATDALSRASTEELLLELRRRIITPREAREVWEDWGGLNPARRLARRGLAAPKISGGAVDHADPIPGWLRANSSS